MLKELNAHAGSDGKLADLMRVPFRTMQQWKAGDGMNASARSLIWIHWALLLHPERCQDEFDLMTWGRFRKSKERKAKDVPPEQDEQPDPQGE